MDVSIIAMIQ